MNPKNLMTTIIFVVMFVAAASILMNNKIEIASKTNIISLTEKAANAPILKSELAIADEESTSTSESETASTPTSTSNTESNTQQAPVVSDPIVYDGLTMSQLSDKLNRSLGSTLSGTGSIFANKAVQLGIDPYLAVAISLHETGCKWNCSGLVTSCNNVGGMIGNCYSSLEEGIDAYMDNLANNYIYQGLNTPELMARKYTGNTGTSWITAVNKYIQSIKNN